MRAPALVGAGAPRSGRRWRPGSSRSSLSNSSVEPPAATLAHQRDHLLGLKDEYTDPSTPARATTTSPGVHTDPSPMGNLHAEGADEAALHARHGATIAGHVGGATGRTFSATRR